MRVSCISKFNFELIFLSFILTWLCFRQRDTFHFITTMHSKWLILCMKMYQFNQIIVKNNSHTHTHLAVMQYWSDVLWFETIICCVCVCYRMNCANGWIRIEWPNAITYNLVNVSADKSSQFDRILHGNAFIYIHLCMFAHKNRSHLDAT